MRKPYNKPETYSQEKLVMNEAVAAGCAIVLMGWENPYNEVQNVEGAYPTAQAALAAHPSDWGWPIAPIFGVKDDEGAMAYFTDWSNAAYANQQSIIYGGDTTSWTTIVRSDDPIEITYTQYGPDGSGGTYSSTNTYSGDEGWWVAYQADKDYLDTLLAKNIGKAQTLLVDS